MADAPKSPPAKGTNSPKKNPYKKGASPKRKGGTPTKATMTRSKTNPRLVCFSFVEPFSFEAYLYLKDNARDAFQNEFRSFARDELVVQSLTTANFTGHKVRRNQGSNDPMKDPEGYWRHVIVCYPQGGSTVASRQEGLRVLKEFFMNGEHHCYPPTDINVMDATDVSNPPALDEFFQDGDIEQIIKADIEAEELDSEFYSKYMEMCGKIYSNEVPSFYVRGLGFPDVMP